MIVVTMELWPGGSAERKETLGTAIIANDCGGTATRGNYNVSLSTRGGSGRIWKAGRVEGFPRKRLLAWDLLFRALRDVVGDRSQAPCQGGCREFESRLPPETGEALPRKEVASIYSPDDEHPGIGDS